ncbi:MAG: TonB-dependent receptor plug domain-containing protein, partial [Sphingobacteriales bacterium]|nr:TonB-dependent receptor plug domain-containing protein [Sphingobacteriales bacterium]
MKNIIIVLVASFGVSTASAQQTKLPDSVKIKSDSVKVLNEVTVTGYKTVNGAGHFLESKDGIIYAGKKNEVILVDSLDANKAINNTRQILGRIPGLNIVETESGGFTANGIATRGLNPIQSIEMNTRQNGYNISADIYGYNEAYYIPPMEAVSRIEMVRGAAS